jgi:hypothetical protein
MSDEAIPPMFGSRRSWSLRQRFVALDSYGLLLLMILATLAVMTIPGMSIPALMAVLRVLVLVGTLGFALHTSGAHRRTYLFCGILAGVALVLTVSLDASTELGKVVAAVSSFLLIVAVLGTVLHRFAAHPVVDGNSILAAICIYLFAGVAFSAVYGFIAAVDTGPLFASGTDGTSVIRVYYSFITLTTTGYGDFVPAADTTRMVAVTEALIGQVYLVTIVALLVSNIGASRRRHVAAENQGTPSSTDKDLGTG